MSHVSATHRIAPPRALERRALARATLARRGLGVAAGAAESSPLQGRYHTQGHAEARRARPLTDVVHFSWSSSHEKSERIMQNRYLLRQLPAKRTASQAPEFPIEATLNRTESLHFLPRSLLRLNVTLKMTSQTCHQLLTAFAGRCSSSPCFCERDAGCASWMLLQLLDPAIRLHPG